jgi:fermentation-respiration switch protein FrsA (DUF1100 family)
VRAAALLLLPPALLALVLLTRLFLRQDRIVFRPSGPAGRTPAAAGLAYEEVRIGAAPRGWWLPAAGSEQAVVYFHGSDGNLGQELAVAGFLAALGVNALLVEYPGYGGDGGRPTERGCYAAGEAAWDFTRRRGFAADRIVLYGVSLGAAVATYLAAARPCGGLVVHSGFTSVPDLAARRYPYLPVRPFCRTRMDSLRRIGDCAAPVLVIHSEDDEHIPVTHARRLFDRAPGPKRFVAIRGSHFGAAWRHQPAVADAWRELLSRRTGSWSVAGAGSRRA